MKKKTAYALALGVAAFALSSPALAHTGGHGWRHHRWHEMREMTYQPGQDLNSDRLNDGSPRATEPPHNARGKERPTTFTDVAYWIHPWY